MKSCSSIIVRPACFLILLGLSSFITSRVWLLIEQNDNNVEFQSIEARNKTISGIESIASLLLPLNSSASNLARSLSSSLNGTELSFLTIQEKVAPSLFLALSTIPHASQVSYMGLDGLIFSFYNDEDHTLAVFSNTSSSSSSVWYTQEVNRDTGKLYGEAVGSSAEFSAYASWFQEALNTTVAFSSLGMSWNNKASDLLFFSTVAMDGRGFISVGFPAQAVTDHFAVLDFHGADFHLAADDGQVLVRSKLPGVQLSVYNGTVSLQMKSNGRGEDKVHNYSCKPTDNDESEQFQVNIKGVTHIFYCSTLQISGVQSVYTLAFSSQGLAGFVHENSKFALILLAIMLVLVAVSIFIFIILIFRAARREMFLCAALIKQMESTQQAERKSMNKSLAFASASHDVRASLAAMTGLIELCHEDAIPNSELAANLFQINTCARDLLCILNSVLDTSKIEAGKMQLEEEEFDLVQLLEDVADMYYPSGMKKGVDVVLDLSDGSLFKLHRVKGDRGKLKQILCNLLSNAVKFTSEGHVSLHAVVRKPSKENAIIASNRYGMLSCLSRSCYKNNGSFSDLDGIHAVQQNADYCMEFVFEVDDTGKGIPKDKQKSVFENFVQVKETALGQEGCGLGLGIVQSLVRLMGGEIKIVDKEQGERGTCFRFNIFLVPCDSSPPNGTEEQQNFYSICNDGLAIDNGNQQHFGLHIRSPAHRSEGSQVVLLIAGEERRRVSKKLVENLGVKVSVVKRVKDMHSVLEKIKQKLEHCHFSSSERIEFEYLNRSASSNSNPGINEGPCSSTKDGHDGSSSSTASTLASCRKSNSNSISKWSSNYFTLVVVDSGAGPFMEICSLVANFRKDIQNSRCKIVWLDNPIMRNSININNCNYFKDTVEDRESLPCDHILSKPFHGSRVYRVLGLLPEFGGTFQCNSPKLMKDCYFAREMHKNSTHESPKAGIQQQQQQLLQLQQIVIHKGGHGQSSEKPMSGKKVLVVEDIALLRKLAATSLTKLGADVVDVCENGKEAFDHVCKALSDQRRDGHSEAALPYDYVFMDCEMPVMDGYEATRLIRKEEKHYGLRRRIPIIALTAHAMAEEANKTMEAGMDFHLTKPLQVDRLLDVIRSMEKKEEEKEEGR